MQIRALADYLQGSSKVGSKKKQDRFLSLVWPSVGGLTTALNNWLGVRPW